MTSYISRIYPKRSKYIIEFETDKKDYMLELEKFIRIIIDYENEIIRSKENKKENQDES